jgi:PAS domain S-box-containing protein
LYRSILHASPDDITIADLEGRVLMVSPAAYGVFGYEAGFDFRASRITDFLVPEDRPRAIALMARRLQGLTTSPVEYRGLRRDGSAFDIEVNSEFIRDAAGTPTGMVVVVRDISERKRAQSERERLEARNRQLQKAESLSRMAGAIAHHFNNQLQAVMMSLELTKQELPPTDGAVEYVVAAMESARKAVGMSTLMLTYLGQTVAEPAPLAVAGLCQQWLPALRATLPEGVELTADLPLPGPVVHADGNQIRQVLESLVTNAWEAGGAGPRVVRLAVRIVAAGQIAARHRYPVDAQLQAGGYACLEVSDAGAGIAAGEFEKIFDPFYSSKFPGRGMGLAVVLGIVRSLDGVVTVESELGKGSIFRVHIPVAGESAGPGIG